MRRLTWVTATLAGCFVLVSCTPVATRGPGPTVPGDTRGPRLPRPDGSPKSTSTTWRYACRGKPVSGWIAIDYVTDPAACPTRGGEYNAAVIVELARFKVGESLEVCAEEHVPGAWSIVHEFLDVSRCPRARPDSTGQRPTVREIRRSY